MNQFFFFFEILPIYCELQAIEFAIFSRPY